MGVSSAIFIQHNILFVEHTSFSQNSLQPWYFYLTEIFTAGDHIPMPETIWLRYTIAQIVTGAKILPVYRPAHPTLKRTFLI